MKITIEKKPVNSKGQRFLMLTRHYGTTTTEEGKVQKIRKRDALNMFVYANPKTSEETQHNKKTKVLTDQILAEKIASLAKDRYHFEQQDLLQSNIFDLMDQMISERYTAESTTNAENWICARKHLVKFLGAAHITFERFNDAYLESFRKYLLTDARTKSNRPLSRNTTVSYFNKIRAVFNEAEKRGIIRRNPTRTVASIAPEDTKREYLIDEELKRLTAAECEYGVLKRAFLFSCVTGMRWSDILKTTWNDVVKTDHGYRIIFKQKKTKSHQYLDLPPDALQFMGAYTKPTERVFKGLKYSSDINTNLLIWVLKQGITKHITFHCGRHTFAVRMLTHGVDIYTVSKLLGHSELKTTQIYADVIESKRIEAMHSLPSILAA
jgi:integrase/recombinase XerD